MYLSENFKKKAKLVLPILIALPIGVSLLTVCFRWIVTEYIQGDLFEEESWNLWIPLALIPVFILFFWIPILKQFYFPKGERTAIIASSLLMLIWLMLVCGFTQNYYTNASNTITTLQHIEDINKVPKTRFYRLQQGNLARITTTAYTNYYTSGKGSTLNMDIYFAIPIFSPGQFAPFNVRYWYGVKFHRTMKNKFSAEIKNNMAKDFFKQCREELDTFAVDRAPYLVHSSNSKMNKFFLYAISKYRGAVNNPPIILIHPRIENFEERNNNTILGFWISLLVGFVLFFLMMTSNKQLLKEEVIL